MSDQEENPLDREALLQKYTQRNIPEHPLVNQNPGGIGIGAGGESSSDQCNCACPKPTDVSIASEEGDYGSCGGVQIVAEQPVA